METGETLLENSSENVLKKSRAELKEIEIADQKRLKEERKKNKQRRLEEKRIADLAKVEKKKKEK